MTTATTDATTDASGEVRPAGTRVEVRAEGGWAAVCALSDLVPGRGVAALLPDGGQIAVFRDRAGRTYALGNRDPFTGAYVLSRGLLGSAGGRAFVASPLLKQRFDLTTGRCLDDDAVSVPVYAVRTR
ncbi:nitrite reductase small subunit NirD [Streptomyces sp. CNQ085]|uniref:nitrite reductase small subunit NirD n=1 Tax=Streptomyces sp. CNQ085 TaxID=2886944 RepID=UPI001F5153DD|nr:nitrite reductase small subunit NirD [Streptomyces sp. CNQ085]MCI0383325.1 nitrite reductase small subunit NirD [Streptomyces sp. CNQ085]